MNQSNKLDHALHNEKACDFLREREEFNDWVVTTAFYSAIHFIEHSLFPGNYSDPRSEDNIKYYTNFTNYYREYTNAEERPLSKHQLRKELVDEYFENEIANDFFTLKDTCHTARYINYKISNGLAKECRNCLKRIKEQCVEVDN